MSVTISRATIVDLPNIQFLNNKLFDLEISEFDNNSLIPDWSMSKYGKNYFSDMIKNHFVLIATDDIHTIGYLAGKIGITETYTKGTLAEIDNMFIDSNYRGRGVGKKLIDVFKAECVLRGVSSIRVGTVAKNRNAIAFYEKQGFEVHNITLNHNL